MLRQIRYFQAVVRLKSFTEAAEECCISQSAVSQQIRALEAELGVQLLLRHNRTFSLTPAGEVFYRKSAVLLADWERLRAETRRAGDVKERLRVGCLNSFGGHEFQLAVARFSARFPDVELTVSHGSHEDLYQALRSGEADVALNDQRRAFSDEYVNRVLAERKCVVELAERNPLAALSRLSPADLKNTPCIVVASQAQRQSELEYQRDVIGFCGDFLFAGSLGEARLMVLQDKGFLLAEEGELPAEFRTAVVQRPLLRGNNQFQRRYCAFWRTDNPNPHAPAFAEILQDQFIAADDKTK